MKEFIEMSKYAGMREDLVQAGGGNSAWKKDTEKMVVKASGYQLSEITEHTGYAVVNYRMIREAFLQVENLETLTQADAEKIIQEAFIEGARPSIETFLHSVSGKYSLHTHPIAVNILTSRMDGMKQLAEMFPDACMVPYATPGVELAKVYFEQYKKQMEHGKDHLVVFLQNHGLLVSADSAVKTKLITEQIVSHLETYLGLDMAGYHAVTQLYDAVGGGIFWRVTDAHVWEAGKKLGCLWQHTFCPDCVVFLGKCMYDAGDEINIGKLEEFRKQYGEPVIYAYQNGMYIHAESVRKALEIQSVLSFAAQVMQANCGCECEFLSEQEQNFLLGWEAETYRSKI